MKILIAGDLAPTQSNFDLFNSGSTEQLLGEELLRIWDSAEARIFNLETPLADSETPIDKCGPNLVAPTNTVKGIKALTPSLLSLANNHIMDQGVRGLDSTRKTLEQNNISYVGVGDDVTHSGKAHALEMAGFRVGFYACAEHEFSIATESSPGANPFDPLESLDHIADLKARSDFVIVLYHGGKEYYRYPSPYLQKVCRKMAEKGADLIVCQHSHCVGCFEQYKESIIVYGQGNFIFDRSNRTEWQTGLIVKVDITGKMDIEFVPIVKKGNVVRLAKEKDAQEILSGFQERSRQIQQEGFIQEQYRAFAKENLESYLRRVSGMGKWMSRIDRYLFKGLLLRLKYNKAKLLALENYIECEAHREVLLEALKQYENRGWKE